tara:strand:+ start:315 stop:551 length:237 start_codon:yes stop_codon:yes gene_type:complete
MTEHKTTTTTESNTLLWGYEEEVSAEEWIRRAHTLVGSSLNTVFELEGDMYLSDFRNLLEFGRRLDNAVKQLNGNANG